jgi:hypothetical protein
MARSSDSRKVLEWQRRMARFEKTRRTVGRFCRDEGVSVPTFYQWRRKLAQRQQGTEDGGEAASGFTPVRLAASAGVAVQLPGGTQLHVPTSDRQALEVVIQTVARVDAARVGGGSC